MLARSTTFATIVWPQQSEQATAHFERDILDRHLIYDYDIKQPETGTDEKWRYEMWFFSEDCIVYRIQGGSMAGRLNYQKADYQCIRPRELWQCNWLEETGTICSLVYDIPNKKIATIIGFSKGHWEEAEQAHGDKRTLQDFARWRKLAGIGKQTDRVLLHEQANILVDFRGAGELKPISKDDPVLWVVTCSEVSGRVCAE